MWGQGELATEIILASVPQSLGGRRVLARGPTEMTRPTEKGKDGRAASWRADREF